MTPDSETIQKVCRKALRSFPNIRRIGQHWNPAHQQFLTQVRSLLREGSKAKDNNWNPRQGEFFMKTIDALIDGFSIGHGAGFRDGTGVVFLDNRGAGGCGPRPAVPEGASCSLRCKLEHDWCLCNDCSAPDADCSEGWPCTSCFECNVAHTICMADCLLFDPPPPPDRLDLVNPVSVVDRIAHDW
jgi:hypothetical protein